MCVCFVYDWRRQPSQRRTLDKRAKLHKRAKLPIHILVTHNNNTHTYTHTHIYTSFIPRPLRHDYMVVPRGGMVEAGSRRRKISRLRTNTLRLRHEPPHHRIHVIVREQLLDSVFSFKQDVAVGAQAYAPRAPLSYRPAVKRRLAIAINQGQ